MLTEVLAVSVTILMAVGSGGAIVFGLSGWLGRVWADRLMAKEQAAHERDLTELRNRLESQAQRALTTMETDLSIFKDKHLRGFHDKLATYRTVIDLVSEILGDFDHWQSTNQPLPAERLAVLNRARLKAYGYLALLASQSVMDAFDRLFDHLLLIAHGNASYVWADVRKLSLELLNEARKDIAIDSSAIEYRGSL